MLYEIKLLQLLYENEFKMLRKTIIMLVLGASMLNITAADENLVHCKNSAEWEGMVKLNYQVKRSGDNSFELYGKYPTEMICKQMIPVDINKTYKLSIWMRTLDQQLPASGYFGLRMYDKNKKPININNVAVFSATETTLVAGIVKGSKELRVAKNERWLQEKYSAVAFNIETDYKDLPNFNISPQIDKIVDEGENYKVILRSSIDADYPAGIKVRLHSPWGNPFFWIASGWMPTEWKQFSAILKGESPCGIPNDKFWTGTKYVRVFIWFGNWDRIPKDGARLLVDDIKFTCE
jgi:hypothetical protein